MHKGNAAGGNPSANQVSHSAKSRSDTTGVNKQKVLVWVLQGTKLVQKRITIGLNDNTQVEVLSGLTTNDLVVTGIVSGPAASAASTAAGGSPFLPKRPPGGGRTR
jgi:HlyD family secretion protein